MNLKMNNTGRKAPAFPTEWILFGYKIEQRSLDEDRIERRMLGEVEPCEMEGWMDGGPTGWPEEIELGGMVWGLEDATPKEAVYRKRVVRKAV